MRFMVCDRRRLFLLKDGTQPVKFNKEFKAATASTADKVSLINIHQCDDDCMFDDYFLLAFHIVDKRT